LERIKIHCHQAIHLAALFFFFQSHFLSLAREAAPHPATNQKKLKFCLLTIKPCFTLAILPDLLP
jgi:hypothetical protein